MTLLYLVYKVVFIPECHVNAIHDDRKFYWLFKETRMYYVEQNIPKYISILSEVGNKKKCFCQIKT